MTAHKPKEEGYEYEILDAVVLAYSDFSYHRLGAGGLLWRRFGATTVQ
jgi:hypothetical protein